MEKEPSKLELFFSGLFPKLILENIIVSTIIYNIGLLLKDFKTKIDNSLNNDI